MTLTCTITKVLFQNPDTHYSVIECKADNDINQRLKLVGIFHNVSDGMRVECTGNWSFDNRYGRRLAVKEYRELLPTTIEGIERYLSSGLIEGIGPVIAKRIVNTFGLDAIKILDEDPQRLKEVKGLSDKTLSKIMKSWIEHIGAKDVMIFLQSYGITSSQAMKIFERFGSRSMRLITDNPYVLIGESFGIGFATADKIAMAMGLGKEDVKRCNFGTLFALQNITARGNVFADINQVIAESMALLDVCQDKILATIKNLTAMKSIIVDGDAIYLPAMYHAEVGCANLLSILAQNDDCHSCITDDRIDSALYGNSIKYDDQQKNAIRTAVRSKLFVMTGDPGTGKTTTINGIISVFHQIKRIVILAAPTGRATKRMSEATGMDAMTIHRMLEYSGETGFQRNQSNKLEGDVLIVDEVSMVDISLMYSLLKAIPEHMTLILVGDIDQLPSVGAGNVLRDILESGTVSSVRLKQVHRQGRKSEIIENAHDINNGMMPVITNSAEGDFFFQRCEDKGDIAKVIVGLVSKRLPAKYGMDPLSIQVLSPMLKGDAGVNMLNMLLQKTLNSKDEGIKHGETTFKVGDKVMQMKNNYKKEVYNGDVGIIEWIDLTNMTLEVNYYGQTVSYEQKELDEISLAYASSIHKSQGSEFDTVIIPVHETHKIMLQRNLIYTGITRAKKRCILVGSLSALNYAVHNQPAIHRNSRLKDRLISLIVL